MSRWAPNAREHLETAALDLFVENGYEGRDDQFHPKPAVGFPEQDLGPVRLPAAFGARTLRVLR